MKKNHSLIRPAIGMKVVNFISNRCLFFLLKDKNMKQFPAILIWVLFFSTSILSAQEKTIKIKIIDKQYVPPNRTLKIPQEFKDKGARFAVRAGDVIEICNADKLFAKPTSLSKENKFQGVEGPGGLSPGNCITVSAQNPANKPVSFWLHDDIHSSARLFMVVLPTNWSDVGEEDTQPNGSGTVENPDYSKFAGTWELQLGSPYGGNTQLTVSNGIISGTSQRNANAIIKITDGYYDAATKKLSFNYVQEWSKKTGKASFDYGENSTNYVLTGTWRDDVSGRGTWVMVKKK